MTSNKLKIHEYYELCLGDYSRQVFLKNILNALGFKYSGPSSLPGLSGLYHEFDAIGRRDRNILLVAGGAEYYDHNRRNKENLNPRERMEQWRNKALLSAYDVQSALTQDKLIVDLMFFQNVNNNHRWIGKDIDPDEWRKRNKVPDDIKAMHSQSIYDMPILSQDELVNIANAIGASAKL